MDAWLDESYGSDGWVAIGDAPGLGRRSLGATNARLAPPMLEGSERPRASASLLWHPGLAQANEISGFEQSTDGRHPEILGGLQVGDAGKATVAAQPSGFGEFPDGAFGLAFEAISRGEPAADERV